MCFFSLNAYRLARDSMNEYLERQNDSTEIVEHPPILEVRIPDALPEAFEKVLHYIYTDRIDCKFLSIDKTHNFFHVWIFFTVTDRTDNKEIVRLMMDIFQLAVQYLITRLENVSIHYLELKISKSNVLDALYYADKMK